MTRDEVIRLMLEADPEMIINIKDHEEGMEGFIGEDPKLLQFWPFKTYVKFAALVAAAEREKIAVWMHGRGYATGHGDTVEDMLEEVEWQAAERERLAWHELAGIGLATKWQNE